MNISRLPLVQSKIILRLWSDPNKMGFAEGREEGGSIKELSKNNIVDAAGKVGRRIRWRLVEGSISEQDIDDIKRLLNIRNETTYSLDEWTRGFEILPGTLSLICSFIAKQENAIIGFAFRVSYLDWISKNLSNDILIPKAKAKIKYYMENGLAKHLDELTFEYESPNFIKVDNPDWWIKSDNEKNI